MQKETIGRATLYLGDAREVLPRLRRQIDAVVTDPPYHLLQASRGGSPRQNNPATPFGCTWSSGGFMGQLWDGGDIAFRPDTWRTIGAALRPGGFLLAFGGTRTYHRMTCAIEDSGFVVQDCLMWLYGSGFPKNRAMLKPAFEPICLAYKPGGKRTMQVDECRISGDAVPVFTNGGKTGNVYGAGIQGSNRTGEYREGRWPANVCHDGSEEVTGAFEQFPTAGHGYFPKRRGPSGIFSAMAGGRGGLHGEAVADSARTLTDTGSAARFFYCAKANKTDRAGSRHPTVKPQALMRWLIPLVTPRGGTVLDPFGGSGSTAEAALATGRRCVLIEREPRWFDDACCRLEAAQLQRKRAA